MACNVVIEYSCFPFLQKERKKEKKSSWDVIRWLLVNSVGAFMEAFSAKSGRVGGIGDG